MLDNLNDLTGVQACGSLSLYLEAEGHKRGWRRAFSAGSLAINS